MNFYQIYLKGELQFHEGVTIIIVLIPRYNHVVSDEVTYQNKIFPSGDV